MCVRSANRLSLPLVSAREFCHWRISVFSYVWNKLLDSLVFETLDLGLSTAYCLVDCINFSMHLGIVPFVSTYLTLGTLHEETEGLLHGESGSDSDIRGYDA